LPQIYGLLNPQRFAAGVRKFPRSLFWGNGLMLLGTAWFLYNVSQESIADFSNYKNILLGLFAGVGIGSCIFVRDFLAVRGLAVVLLLWGSSWWTPEGQGWKTPPGCCDTGLGLYSRHRRHVVDDFPPAAA
jgi:hypothetical protein